MTKPGCHIFTFKYLVWLSHEYFTQITQIRIQMVE